MFRNGLQTWHVLVMLVIIFLLFGANRLPGLAKSVGESLKIFKKEIKDLADDGKDDGTDAGTPVAPAAPAAPPAATTPSTPDTTPGAGADGGTIPGLVDPNHPRG
ncbi:Sec-independent protein translocase subunit TatA [Xylanimonas sp. McL0601]|uniref:Sec-independent protein translocase subunit TatA n=1 Tax=Xylanimonas sp. McL0601 TaxID=3414739 RepID=UPI003CEB007E